MAATTRRASRWYGSAPRHALCCITWHNNSAALLSLRTPAYVAILPACLWDLSLCIYGITLDVVTSTGISSLRTYTRTNAAWWWWRMVTCAVCCGMNNHAVCCLLYGVSCCTTCLLHRHYHFLHCLLYLTTRHARTVATLADNRLVNVFFFW